MLPELEATTAAVDSEACFSKPDPRGEPPLAFYALFRPREVCSWFHKSVLGGARLHSLRKKPPNAYITVEERLFRAA